MTRRYSGLAALLALAPLPALASAGAPGLTSPIGIVLMIILLILGVVIGWVIKR
jgi:hypothetical protein